MNHRSISSAPYGITEPDSAHTILEGIKRKAASTDLYYRLMGAAPTQHHGTSLQRMLEDEQRHWQQLTDLYMSMTGTQPSFHPERIEVSTYLEGLHKGYEKELAGYEHFRIACLNARHQEAYDVLMNACMDGWAHAKQLNSLAGELSRITSEDYGPAPYVINIDEATVNNEAFRKAIWTGRHLQVTLMSIKPGEEIGLEIHPYLDQFLRLEQGNGVVKMGDRQDLLTFEKVVSTDDAIIIPAGTWHNLINTGQEPIKLYSIYAPPQHPHGTVHQTKADAEAAEAGMEGNGYTY
ncbi:cupin domain-containing protein [Bacillus sp. KH172YL63]|uniref:cupin domain-containing protein n=1 Tax=Bacillus sp. KH172YL63 TaxID=2709784 RepID=UPI0013E4128E|nr:cupin domain-containing protein [Bacillus sp. KH172YL63]BCB03927.1 hypothetical protein KH172YL63_20600 [Bacillus sp. KH172YL63]